MDLEKVIRRRHMTRSFKPTDVPQPVIEKILLNAIKAPSAGHLQPWEFVVVRDSKIKYALAEAALEQYFLAEAPVVVATCANTERSARRYGDRGRKFYSIIDTAFASLIILLTATNVGLGACFVGAFHDDEVARILRLPDHVRPVGLIGIGHSAEPAEKHERIPLRKVLHFERFQP